MDTTPAVLDSKPKVPLEVSAIVLKFSATAELRNLRLVSRSFNQFVIPIIYKDMTLRMDTTEEDMARRSIFTHGSLVRNLELVAVTYDNMTVSSFAKAARKQCLRKRVSYRPGLAQKVFRCYNVRRRAHKAAVKSGLTHAYVLSLMANMPNLVGVEIGDGVSYPGRGLLGSDKTYTVIPDPDSIPRSGVSNWNMLSQALSASQAPYTKLAVETFLDSGSQPLLNILQGPRLGGVLNLATRLTTLRLDLDFYQANPWKLSLLARVLSQATNLEALYLHETSWASIDPELGDILRGCRYPNLQVCVLDCFQSDSDDLLGFLWACQNLTDLSLRSIALNDSTWQNFAPKLKSVLPLLEYIELTNEVYTWYRLFVFEYFFCDGPNPFKDDSMEDYLEEDNKEFDEENKERGIKEDVVDETKMDDEER
ncbi:MAG: hypothetical protein Q9169_006957 [Polycauliona sp. 2 TL-2023]